MLQRDVRVPNPLGETAMAGHDAPMFSRAPLRSALMLVVLALCACKLGKKEETAPSAAPTPEATVAPTPEATAAATPATTDTTTPPSTTTTTTTKKTDAGTTKDAAAADAGTTAASDASAAKNAACQSKCNGIMQACLTPSVKEGGLPSFADPTKCKAAFDECAKACK